MGAAQQTQGRWHGSHDRGAVKNNPSVDYVDSSLYTREPFAYVFLRPHQGASLLMFSRISTRGTFSF